jgi:hypothetical protein
MGNRSPLIGPFQRNFDLERDSAVGLDSGNAP